MYKTKLDMIKVGKSMHNFYRLRGAFIYALDGDSEFLELPMPKDTEKVRYLSDAGELLLSKATWSFYQNLLKVIKDAKEFKVKGVKEKLFNRHGQRAIQINLLQSQILKVYQKYTNSHIAIRNLKVYYKNCKSAGLITEKVIEKRLACRHIKKSTANVFELAEYQDIIKFLDFHHKLGIQTFDRKGIRASLDKQIKIKVGWRWEYERTDEAVEYLDTVNSYFARWLRCILETVQTEKLASPNKKIRCFINEYQNLNWIHDYLNSFKGHHFKRNELQLAILSLPAVARLLENTELLHSILADKTYSNLQNYIDNWRGLLGCIFKKSADFWDAKNIFGADFWDAKLPKSADFWDAFSSALTQILNNNNNNDNSRQPAGAVLQPAPSDIANFTLAPFGTNIKSALSDVDYFAKPEPAGHGRQQSLTNNRLCGVSWKPALSGEKNKRSPHFHISGKQGENNMKKKKQAKVGKKVYKTGKENQHEFTKTEN